MADTPMRIAFYAPLKAPDDPVPSGDRLMARQIIAALKMGGHEVVVASTLRAYRRTPDTDALAGLKRAASDETADILARWSGSPGWRPDIWLTYHGYYKAPDLIGPQVAQGFAVPYVCVESSFARKRRSDGWADWTAAAEVAMRRARAHFHLTDDDRQGLAELVGADRLFDLPPFIDASRFAQRQPREDGGSVRLVTVAMMRARAKLDSYRLLAEALGELRDLDWTLEIVGDGPERASVEALFAGLPEGRIGFTGELDAEGVAAALARADMFVWPGVGEAYGLVYLEAQAAGLPVVALERAPARAVIRRGETGLLTGETARGYADAIRRMIGTADVRTRMGEAARAFVQGERTIAAAAGRFNAAFAAIATPPPAQPVPAAGFPRTQAALDVLAGQGRTLRIWLRDDDCVAPTKPLDRLLALAATHQMPLMLAVIPRYATKALADRLAGVSGVTIAPHGLAHIDHASADQKSCEFGADRDAGQVAAELSEGRQRIYDLFAEAAIPLFVPPWNRMAPNWHAALVQAGFSAISGFGAKGLTAGDGLRALPTHVDIMDWSLRAGRPADEVDAEMADWIERLTAGEGDTPLGLLTHHLVHDETAWNVLEALLTVLSTHRAVRFTDARDQITV